LEESDYSRILTILFNCLYDIIEKNLLFNFVALSLHINHAGSWLLHLQILNRFDSENGSKGSLRCRVALAFGPFHEKKKKLKLMFPVAERWEMNK